MDENFDRELNQEIGEADLMLAGIEEHRAQLSHVGGDEAFTTAMEEEKKEVVRLNAKQESLKSELKETTVLLKTARTKMLESLTKGRKMVKFVLPQESWVRCGIRASK